MLYTYLGKSATQFPDISVSPLGHSNAFFGPIVIVMLYHRQSSVSAPLLSQMLKQIER